MNTYKCQSKYPRAECSEWCLYRQTRANQNNGVFCLTEKQHLLAVGDNAGTLHILEIPWSLRQPTPNEVSALSPLPHPGLSEPVTSQNHQFILVSCDCTVVYDTVLSFWLQVTGISNYFEREVKRRAFVVMRWDFRESEKRELEQEQKRKAGVSQVNKVNWWCRTWFRQLRMLPHTVSWYYPCCVFVN